MKTRLPSFRCPALAAAALLFLAALPTRAHALFTFTLAQVGANVVVTGSGTLNTAALTLASTGTSNPIIFPTFGAVIAGPANSNVDNYKGFTTPGSFGSGMSTSATSSTGNPVGIASAFGGLLNVPTGYTSGSALSNTSTYANSTISSLGLTPGNYAFTWGTGATADSLVVNVPSGVPEPSTCACVAAGAGLLGFVVRRRRTGRVA